MSSASAEARAQRAARLRILHSPGRSPRRQRNPGLTARMQVVTRRRTPAASCGMLSAKQGSVEMRKITFAVYNPPKEGLPYLAAIIAPNGAVAAVAYQTAANAIDHSIDPRVFRIGSE